MTRVVRLMIVLGVSLALVPVAQTQAQRVGCSHVHVERSWTTIDYPTFPASSYHNSYRDSAEPFVTGGSRLRLFATDRTTILRSLDGGCTWRSVFSLDPSAGPQATADGLGDLARLDPTDQIIDISTSLPIGRAAPYVYALVARVG